MVISSHYDPHRGTRFAAVTETQWIAGIGNLVVMPAKLAIFYKTGYIGWETESQHNMLCYMVMRNE
jgi:hypothetical protein